MERPDGSTSEYFIDAETVLPLGRVEHDRGARLIERVTVLEALPPTPQSLAKVRAP